MTLWQAKVSCNLSIFLLGKILTTAVRKGSHVLFNRSSHLWREKVVKNRHLKNAEEAKGEILRRPIIFRTSFFTWARICERRKLRKTRRNFNRVAEMTRKKVPLRSAHEPELKTRDSVSFSDHLLSSFWGGRRAPLSAAETNRRRRFSWCPKSRTSSGR